MKKKKIIISICAVCLALATVGGILGIGMYKKRLAPIKAGFIDRPDSVIVHYTKGSAEPVSKELSKQEITALYHDMQALLLRGDWMLDQEMVASSPLNGSRPWDHTSYESRKHRGSIELHYEKPRKFQLAIGTSYELPVCDTVIIEFQNTPATGNRPGIEIATAYQDIYSQNAYHFIALHRDYYNIFFDEFVAMF